jgi:hypothetical protein
VVTGAPQADGFHNGASPLRVGGGGGLNVVLRDAQDTDQWSRSTPCRSEQQPRRSLPFGNPHRNNGSLT